MKRAVVTALFLASVMACGAQAQVVASDNDVAAVDRFGACIHDANAALPAMLVCARAEHRRLDAGLNHIWQEYVLALRQPLQDKVRAAQRKWIEYRDLTCEAERASFLKKPEADVAHGYCLIRQTMAQTQWVKTILEGPRQER